MGDITVTIGISQKMTTEIIGKTWENMMIRQLGFIFGDFPPTNEKRRVRAENLGHCG